MMSNDRQDQLTLGRRRRQRGIEAQDWTRMMQRHQGNQNNEEDFNRHKKNDSWEDCDPRLSRAARDIVRELLLDFLRLEERHHRHQQQDASERSSDFPVWQLLQQIFDNPKEWNPQQCPLHPPRDRDFLWDQHERHVHLIPAKQFRNQHIHNRNTAGLARRGSFNMLLLPPQGYAHNPYLYQSNLTQKVFATRYYLDLHSQRKRRRHQKDSRGQANMTNSDHKQHKNNHQHKLCPAQEWCPFLPHECHERALELEPYYGPGSEGRREEDRRHIEQRLWKQAHARPCTKETEQRAEQACQQVLEKCFLGDSGRQAEFNEFWKERVCQHLTCPDRLHRWYFAANHAAVKHVHEWQEEWTQWSSWSTASTPRILWLLLLFLLGYGVHYYFYLYQEVERQPSRGSPQSRLLKRKPRKRNVRSLSDVFTRSSTQKSKLH